MTTPIQYYLINKTNTTLVLKGGALDILPGRFAHIDAETAFGVSVTNLVAIGMAVLNEGLPEPDLTIEKEITIDTHVPYQGMTAEELKADNASKATDTSNGFTTEAIGRKEPEAAVDSKAKKVTKA
jgi:hypothetical protein